MSTSFTLSGLGSSKKCSVSVSELRVAGAGAALHTSSFQPPVSSQNPPRSTNTDPHRSDAIVTCNGLWLLHNKIPTLAVRWVILEQRGFYHPPQVLPDQTAPAQILTLVNLTSVKSCCVLQSVSRAVFFLPPYVPSSLHLVVGSLRTLSHFLTAVTRSCLC